MDSIRIANLIFAVVGLTLSVIGFVQTLISRHMDRRTRSFFFLFFGLLIFYVASNLLGQRSTGEIGSDWARFSRTVLFSESLSSSLLLPLLMIYLLFCSGESEWRRSAAFRTVAVLWLIYAALLSSTWFSPLIYSIDESNLYRRGPLYPLLLVPPVLIMAVTLVTVWRRRNALSNRQRVAIAIYAIAPMASMLAQMWFYGLYFIVFGTAVSAGVMFAYVLIDQTEQYARQSEENAELRTDIMLSQIKPHFLYNSLGAIQSLCRSDPAEAEKAVAEFSRYLRGNMNALAREKTIPFAQELEHTKTYLALEKLRYEDELQLRYELRCTDFRIPPLTLQPIAENAVRHGVRGNASGCGTVCIASAEYPDRWEITVTDDGPGFDPAQPPADGNAHIGLQNVRERLKRAVDGELRIEASPGNGTKVTIILPKEGNSLADLRDR